MASTVVSPSHAKLVYSRSFLLSLASQAAPSVSHVFAPNFASCARPEPSRALATFSSPSISDTAARTSGPAHSRFPPASTGSSSSSYANSRPTHAQRLEDKRRYEETPEWADVAVSSHFPLSSEPKPAESLEADRSLMALLGVPLNSRVLEPERSSDFAMPSWAGEAEKELEEYRIRIRREKEAEERERQEFLRQRAARQPKKANWPASEAPTAGPLTALSEEAIQALAAQPSEFEDFDAILARKAKEEEGKTAGDLDNDDTFGASEQFSEEPIKAAPAPEPVAAVPSEPVIKDIALPKQTVDPLAFGRFGAFEAKLPVKSAGFGAWGDAADAPKEAAAPSGWGSNANEAAAANWGGDLAEGEQIAPRFIPVKAAQSQQAPPQSLQPQHPHSLQSSHPQQAPLQPGNFNPQQFFKMFENSQPPPQNIQQQQQQQQQQLHLQQLQQQAQQQAAQQAHQAQQAQDLKAAMFHGGVYPSQSPPQQPAGQPLPDDPLARLVSKSRARKAGPTAPPMGATAFPQTAGPAAMMAAPPGLAQRPLQPHQLPQQAQPHAIQANPAYPPVDAYAQFLAYQQAGLSAAYQQPPFNAAAYGNPAGNYYPPGMAAPAPGLGLPQYYGQPPLGQPQPRQQMNPNYPYNQQPMQQQPQMQQYHQNQYHQQYQ